MLRQGVDPRNPNGLEPRSRQADGVYLTLSDMQLVTGHSNGPHVERPRLQTGQAHVFGFAPGFLAVVMGNAAETQVIYVAGGANVGDDQPPGHVVMAVKRRRYVA